MVLSLRKLLVAMGVVSVLAFSPARAVTPDELFEVLQRIESLENEVRYLRGENEQLRFDMEDIKNTQKRTFIRIDDRMDDLFRAVNTRKTSSATPPLPVPVVPKLTSVKPAVVMPKVFAIAQPVVVESAKAPQVIALPAVKKPVQKADVLPNVSAVEKRAYDQAFANIKTKPSAAISMFRQFLKRYPNSGLAPNAQYWLGEVMYSSRNYQGAVNEFVAVLQSYGDSKKAPDAAIKLGFSFYEMKNWVYARRSLEDVLRSYPKSNAAKLARVRLTKMQKENLY
ncbi:MAG: tol-pal system protein YbgF [Leucothrix sp.]